MLRNLSKTSRNVFGGRGGKYAGKGFKSTFFSPFSTLKDLDPIFSRLKKFLLQTQPELISNYTSTTKNDVHFLMENYAEQKMPGEEATLLVMAADKTQDASFVLEVYEKLTKLGITISPMSLQLVSTACKEEGNSQVVLEVLQQMRQMPYDVMQPCPFIFSNAISACSQQNKWMNTLQLIQEMRQHDMDITYQCYCDAIKSCVESNEVTATFKLLREFLADWKDNNDFVEDDVKCVLDSVLMGFIKMKNCSASIDMFNFFEENGYSKPLHAISNMINLCAASGEWFHADRFISLLNNTPIRALSTYKPGEFFKICEKVYFASERSSEIEVSFDMYNGLLKASGRVGNVRATRKIMKQMKQVGLKPDKYSYLYAISACHKLEFEYAMKLFQDLKKSNIELDLDLYNCFIWASSKAQQWEMIVDLVTEMSAKDIRVNDRSLSALVIAFTKMKRHNDSVDIFCNMKVQGIEPNSFAYSHAMLSYAYLGQWYNSIKLFHHFRRTILPVPPSDSMYKVVFKALEIGSRKLKHKVEEDEDEDEDEDEEDEEEGGSETIRNVAVSLHNSYEKEYSKQPNLAIMETLIQVLGRACCSSSLAMRDSIIEDFRNIWKKCLDSNIIDISLLNAALLPCVNMKYTNMAERIIEEASSLGVTKRQFNPMTLSLLMRLYSEADREKMMDWYKFYVNQNFTPTFNIYVSLLKAQDNDIEKGLALLEEMIQKNIRPNRYVYVDLLRISLNDQNAVAAEKIMDDMTLLRVGFCPRSIGYLVCCVPFHPQKEAFFAGIIDHLFIEPNELVERRLEQLFLACRSCGLTEEALGVYNTLDSNSVMNVNSFNYLLDCCINKNMLKMGFQIMKDMYDRDFLPPKSSIFRLCDRLSENNEVSLAFEILNWTGEIFNQSSDQLLYELELSKKKEMA